MRSFFCMSIFAATLAVQGLFIDVSEAQRVSGSSSSIGSSSSFNKRYNFPDGYLILEYNAGVKALNIRSMSNSGSGTHNYIGIGWPYFWTNSIEGKKVKGSYDSLSTCVSSNFILIAALLNNSTLSSDPYFSWSSGAIATACDSVLPSGTVPGHFRPLPRAFK